VNSVNSQNRALAAQSAGQEKAIYRTIQYTSGKEYLGRILRAQSSPTDPFGEGTMEDQQQRAEAQLEFTQRAEGKTPQELTALRDEIADRYLKRRADKSGDPLKAYQGRIRYNTATEAAAAYRAGKLSASEMATHTNYFKLKGTPK
jgi:hypothetical protein